MQERNQSLEIEITHVCNLVPELNILEDAVATTKIMKLASPVHESKYEIGRVMFEFQMKISELQLKLHPTTL